MFNGVNHALLRLPAPVRRRTLDVIAQLPFSLVYPRVFMIEPTNICNGTCPLCPVGARIDKRRKGHLDYDKFVQLIDEIRDIARMVIMNFAGEPILNRRIGDLAAYAESYGIPVVIGTNGTLDKAEELVDSGVSEILFALDGATAESYSQYRIYRDGTDFNTVVENLRRIVERKRELGVEKPTIILQFVVFRHNQHEIGDILRLGEEIGVDGVDFKPVCINDFFEPDLDELVEQFQPEHDDTLQILADDFTAIKPPWCSFSFHETEILWNGDVTTCCYDYDGDYVIGNVFTDGGFKKVWKSREYRKIRKKIVRQKLKICKTCDHTMTKPTRIYFDEDPAKRTEIAKRILAST
jgi:radical SAM protein with 4Fe4S-binding SPASM domain